MRTSYDIFKQIHASKGMQYLNRRKTRAFTLNVFQGNLAELRKTCDLIENPNSGLRLMNASINLGNDAAHMEVLRHFHNFLAAAKSLVDHSRFFIDEHYSGTSIHDAYTQKVESDLAKDPLVKFVQDLRNYMLHRDLPASSMSINVTKIENSIAQDLTTAVTIDKQAILTWNNWTKLSKDYLSNAAEQIPISSISTPYGEKILSFYQWFDSKLEKYHKPEIDEFTKLRKEYLLLDEIEKEKHSSSKNTTI